MSIGPIQRAVAIIPKVTGFISLLGSSFMTYDILHRPEKRSKLVNRIILGMSISDVIYSIFTCFLSTWPVPVTLNNQVFLASGSQSTCVAQGFIDQWSGRSSYTYNTILSIHYMLTVRFQQKDDQLVKFEPIVHALPLLLGLGTSIAVAATNTFNATGGWTCWIAASPIGCDQEGSTVECVRGGNARWYRLWFNSVPLWICEIIMGISMVSLFTFVLQKEKASDRYSMSANHSEKGSRKLSKQVATQGALYVLSFYITWLFTTVRIIIDFVPNQNNEDWSYVLESFLLPLQGFWNCIVYFRPRYLKRRKENSSAFSGAFSQKSKTNEEKGAISSGVATWRSSGDEGTGDKTPEKGNTGEAHDRIKGAGELNSETGNMCMGTVEESKEAEEWVKNESP